MLKTRLDDAAATVTRFGYRKSAITRQGLIIDQRTRAFLERGREARSLHFRWWIVSGRSKNAPMLAAPARAVCKQKITRQLV